MGSRPRRSSAFEASCLSSEELGMTEFLGWGMVEISKELDGRMYE